MSREARDRDAAPVSPPLRVFVVENDDDTRELMVLLLEQFGHAAMAAGSVGEALRAIPQAAPDVLISDLGLPDGTGWELLVRLGASRPPYAIALTGFALAADRQRSAALGFRHHLIKPLEPELLEQLLEEAAVLIGRRPRPPSPG